MCPINVGTAFTLFAALNMDALPMNTKFRIIQFFVHDEPTLRFDDLVAIVDEEMNFPQIKTVGDTCVLPCEDGCFVMMAVRPFRDLSIADSAFGKEWRERATKAIIAVRVT